MVELFIFLNSRFGFFVFSMEFSDFSIFRFDLGFQIRIQNKALIHENRQGSESEDKNIDAPTTKSLFLVECGRRSGDSSRANFRFDFRFYEVNLNHVSLVFRIARPIATEQKGAIC